MCLMRTFCPHKANPIILRQRHVQGKDRFSQGLQKVYGLRHLYLMVEFRVRGCGEQIMSLRVPTWIVEQMCVLVCVRASLVFLCSV